MFKKKNNLQYRTCQLEIIYKELKIGKERKKTKKQQHLNVCVGIKGEEYESMNDYLTGRKAISC